MYSTIKPECGCSGIASRLTTVSVTGCLIRVFCFLVYLDSVLCSCKRAAGHMHMPSGLRPSQPALVWGLVRAPIDPHWRSPTQHTCAGFPGHLHTLGAAAAGWWRRCCGEQRCRHNTAATMPPRHTPTAVLWRRWRRLGTDSGGSTIDIVG